MMFRRKFIGLLLVVAFGTLFPLSAYADEKPGQIILTDSLACEMAQGFADTMYAGEALTAQNPVVLSNDEGQAIGYIVSFFDADGPHGYIVFDNTQSSLISEYVIDDGVLNPFVNYNDLTRSVPMALSDDECVVVKTAPYTYAVASLSTDETVDNYGNDVLSEMVAPALAKKMKRSPDGGSWNDVFVDYNSSQYTLQENKWITPFIGRSETQIRNATGGYYACAVTALIDCAEFYDPNFASTSIADHFWGISNATETSYDGFNGGTTPTKEGPGFVNYMASRGITVSTIYRQRPSYGDFKSHLDGWNMCLFGGQIIYPNNRRVGHAMSVQGYMVFKPNGINESIYTLGVHDGWNTYARNLNYWYSTYDYFEGVYLWG